MEAQYPMTPEELLFSSTVIKKEQDIVVSIAIDVCRGER